MVDTKILKEAACKARAATLSNKRMFVTVELGIHGYEIRGSHDHGRLQATRIVDYADAAEAKANLIVMGIDYVVKMLQAKMKAENDEKAK